MPCKQLRMRLYSVHMRQLARNATSVDFKVSSAKSQADSYLTAEAKQAITNSLTQVWNRMRKLQNHADDVLVCLSQAAV